MNEGIDSEIDFLREKIPPDHAWVIFQVILEGHVADYPDRFIELMDPIERIFLIRHGAFHDPDLRPGASKSVLEVLDTLDLDQRELLEGEIVPLITRAFNISKISNRIRFKGNRDHQ